MNTGMMTFCALAPKRPATQPSGNAADERDG
jgi:hypothetical protein